MRLSTHKYMDRICMVSLVLALLVTLFFANADAFGVTAVSAGLGYESRIFDDSRVHTIDIVMDDWDGFIDSCENEEYEVCAVVIDNESYKNVGIRAKGNTSLTSVASYGNDRYSFKIEFDHYDNTKNYYGLDQMNLNNIIQDNTYMKDYLTYQMMGEFDVAAPLCSYVYVTVNGEDWGLYLAVESVEESFLERNYGSDYGELYKPDSMSMAGGNKDNKEIQEKPDSSEKFTPTEDKAMQEGLTPPEDGTIPEGFTLPEDGTMPEGASPPEEKMVSGDGESQENRDGRKGMGKGGMKSDDVSLIYSDDDPDSYSNIFDNAKTDTTDADEIRLIASLKNLNEGNDIENVVNVEEVIRYFVVHNFVCNFDSYTGSIIHNYYLYEEDGQMSMIPWDYNLAFGGFQSESDAQKLVNYPIDSPVSGGTIESRPMLAWIFDSEEYTQMYHDYFGEFIAEFYDSEYVQKTIDTITELISPYVEKDPTKFCTYEEFLQGAETLEEFCALRFTSVAGQLAGEIPSTSEGQSGEDAALVEASAVVISDMGDMGSMGKDRGNRSNVGQEE